MSASPCGGSLSAKWVLDGAHRPKKRILGPKLPGAARIRAAWAPTKVCLDQYCFAKLIKPRERWADELAFQICIFFSRQREAGKQSANRLQPAWSGVHRVK